MLVFILLKSVSWKGLKAGLKIRLHLYTPRHITMNIRLENERLENKAVFAGMSVLVILQRKRDFISEYCSSVVSIISLFLQFYFQTMQAFHCR
jgi:hypothetical protein